MGSADSETFFAKPGRASQAQLADQIGRTLEDPCVKVLLDAVTGFVMILNEDRQILGANRELVDALKRDDPNCIVGLRPGEALNCIHYTSGTDGCGTAPHCRTCGAVLSILAAQSSGQPAEDECRLSVYREDKLHAFDLKVRSTPLEIGGCRLTALVLHDISALKRREVLEQTFLHDFLNTLGGIAVWSELLDKADPRTAAQEIAALVQSLREEVVGQRTLLSAERGELVAQTSEFDAAAFLSRLELIFAHHPIAKDRRLSIAPVPERTRFNSDKVLLARVLVNMLKNAFEAIPPGGTVRLSFEWRGDEPVFAVHNDNVIPAEVQARVFERSFSTRAAEGRGIGTYSMKLYGERYLGGKVSFTSTAEDGTRFTIALPAQPAAVPSAAPPAEAPAARPALQRILLVDDEEMLLRFGKFLLERLGYAVTACGGGASALDAFAAAPGSFSAVVTDWRMPHMSGEELIRRLRELRPDVPILVCTGMDDSVLASSNVHHSIGKPFTFEEMARAVRNAIAGRAAGASE